MRNYQDDIKRRGGTILFECKGAECGGSPNFSSRLRFGGFQHMSISAYLYPEERVKEPLFSNGACALKEEITDQRYAATELPSAHVSVLTYTVTAPRGGCAALNDRTVAVIDILEGKGREEKMVTVRADEMATSIAGMGRVALYGIYFDSNRAEIRPESDATLQQIGSC